MITNVTPLPTLVLSYLLERKTYVTAISSLVVLQVLSAVLAVPNVSSSASVYGIFLGSAST
jgi:hypothetical protein